MKRKTILSGAVAALAIAAPAVAETTLRLATITPDNTVWTNQVNRYAEKVAELSGGELTLEVFANAELGTMADTAKMMLSGRLDMWVGVTPVMASVTPELATMTLPYLFESSAQVKCAVPKLEEDIRAAIGEKYELISMLAVGSQSIGLDGEGSLPSDLEGKKIRSAPLPSSLAFFQAMGATPQPLPAAETPAALSTGLVEGVDFAIAFYVQTGSNKLASNLIPTKHVLNLGGLVVSPRSWAKLSEEEQGWLHEAASALEFGNGVDEIDAFEAQMQQVHIDSGGTVTELSEEDLAAWREVGQSVWDGIVSDMGEDSQAFMEKVNMARESCM